MSNPGEARRRHRRRAPAAQAPAAQAPAAQAPAPAPAPAEPGRREPAAPTPDRVRRRRPPGESGDRGLRDLVGSGRSQLGVSGALRGRDVNRPTDDELAEAEREIVIVRRNWRPGPGED